MNFKKHLFILIITLLGSFPVQAQINVLFDQNIGPAMIQAIEGTQDGEILRLAFDQFQDKRLIQVLIQTLLDNPNIQLSIALDNDATKNNKFKASLEESRAHFTPSKKLNFVITKITESIRATPGMHNKFLISGDHTLITGSANGTMAAFGASHEQALIVTRDDNDVVGNRIIDSFSNYGQATAYGHNPHVLFSNRNGAINKLILDKINAAQSNQPILISLFSLTDENIIQALVKARQRKCIVRMLTNPGHVAQRLAESGIHVYVSNNNGTATLLTDESTCDMPSALGNKYIHQKIAIIGDEVLLGSGNWTTKAKDQYNNLVILHQSEAPNVYQACRERLFGIFGSMEEVASSNAIASILQEHRARAREVREENDTDRRFASQLQQEERESNRNLKIIEAEAIEKALRESRETANLPSCSVCFEPKERPTHQWACSHPNDFCCAECHKVLKKSHKKQSKKTSKATCPICREEMNRKQAEARKDGLQKKTLMQMTEEELYNLATKEREDLSKEKTGDSQPVDKKNKKPTLKEMKALNGIRGNSQPVHKNNEKPTLKQMQALNEIRKEYSIAEANNKVLGIINEVRGNLLNRVRSSDSALENPLVKKALKRFDVGELLSHKEAEILNMEMEKIKEEEKKNLFSDRVSNKIHELESIQSHLDEIRAKQIALDPTNDAKQFYEYESILAKVITQIIEKAPLVLDYHSNTETRSNLTNKALDQLDGCCWASILNLIYYKEDIFNFICDSTHKPGPIQKKLFQLKLDQYMHLHLDREDFQEVNDRLYAIQSQIDEYLKSHSLI